MTRKPTTDGLTKAEFLRYWRGLKADPLRPKPVPYHHEGSTYAEDGIRITGRREWIDSVIGRLSDLLEYDTGHTRLQVIYRRATDRQGGELDAWTCYISIRARGGYAAQPSGAKKPARTCRRSREVTSKPPVGARQGDCTLTASGRILAVLGPEALDADTIGDRAGLPAPEVLGALLALELAGQARRLQGNRYVREN